MGHKMKEEKVMVDRRGSRWKQYAVYGLTAFAVIAASILLIFMFIRHEDFAALRGKITKALAPCMVGALMAYLMNPLMVFFEGKIKWLLYKRMKKITRANKIARVLSIIITLIIVLLVISYLSYLLIPQLITTLTGIVNNFSGQVNRIEEWYRGLELEKTVFGDYIEMAFVKATDYLQDFFQNRLLDSVTKVLGSVATGVWSFIGTIYNIVLGLIFSIYILGCKEKLVAISKKIIYAVFKRRRANTIIRITRACHFKFTASITGKIVDSIIIGLLCFVAMKLFDIPYPTLVSVIVGVTNVIPFFGPFIGAIPSAIIILFASPVKCLYFIILVFVLQQLDGNVIGPKIVGESVGLSPFWVLFACTTFGSLWGIVGMLIAAPLMACLYMIIKEIVENRLHHKGLMTETVDYQDLDKVDETEMFTMTVDMPEATSEQSGKAAGGAESGESVGKVAVKERQPERKKDVSDERRQAIEEAPNAPEYIPVSIKELNRMAGRQIYTIDTDFEHEPEEVADEKAKQQAAEGEKKAGKTAGRPAKKKNPIDIVKGLIHRK